MKSETEYKTEKNGDVDVYKATTRVTFTEGELEEFIRLYAEITELNAKRINNAFENLCNTMAESIERVTNALNGISKDFEKLAPQVPVEDIPYLKKQIKHCKNPLEEKALQKRLNAALKKAKGKR
jgi:hypothetical protein